jgi:hypothetical protein
LVDSFYALDGGRPYKDLTVQDFAAQRTAASEETVKATIRAIATTQVNEVINPAIATGIQADIVSALRSAADTLENG